MSTEIVSPDRKRFGSIGGLNQREAANDSRQGPVEQEPKCRIMDHVRMPM